MKKIIKFSVLNIFILIIFFNRNVYAFSEKNYKIDNSINNNTEKSIQIEIQNTIDNKIKNNPSKDIENILDSIVKNSINKINSKPLSSREYYEVEKKVGTYYHTFTVIPSGQPPQGYRLRDGGCIYINTDGGNSTTFSVNLGGSIVGVSVSTGYATKTNALGVCVNLPNSVNSYIVRVHKKYKIYKYKVDVYEFGNYTRSYYIYPKILLSYDFEPIKI